MYADGRPFDAFAVPCFGPYVGEVHVSPVAVSLTVLKYAFGL